MTGAPRSPYASPRSGIAIGLVLLLAGGALWQLAPTVDMALYRLLHADIAARWLPLLIRFTDAGGAAVMIPIALAAVLGLAVMGQRGRAAWLFATIASGRVLVELAKIVCARPRPLLTDRLVPVTSLSFPSSHSAGTMLTCCALCVALGAGRRGWAVAILFALGIGTSRIALGVHWPSDVLGGWGVGLLWVSLLALRAPQGR